MDDLDDDTRVSASAPNAGARGPVPARAHRGAHRPPSATGGGPVHQAPAPAERVIFDALPAPAAVLDADGWIRMVNVRWEQVARDGDGRAVGAGANYFAMCEEVLDDDTARAALEGLRSLVEGTRSELSLLHAGRGPDASRWFRLEAEPLAIWGATHLLVRHLDVTEQIRTLHDVRLRSRLLDEVDAAVIATDLEGTVTLWNRGAERLYGWSAVEAEGTDVLELTVPDGFSWTAVDLIEELRRTGSWEGRFDVAHRNGTIVPAFVRNTLVHDEQGEVVGAIGIGVDLTEHVALQAQATHSSRQLRAVTQSIGEGLCTLDGHGRITYVNPAGEQLLASSLVGAHGTRLSDWILHDPGAGADGELAGSSGLVATLHPVECELLRGDGTRLLIEYVVRELHHGDDGDRAGWTIVFRDVSARRARELELREQAEKAAWAERITDALDNDRFELHAQPIVELATNATVQHELLIRMRDRDDPARLISPGAFLPAAEQLGLATDVDHWVVRRALELSDGTHAVEINLSAISIGDESLPADIEEQIEATGADPAKIVFEITETALLENDEAARQFAQRVRRLGCRLALDDFGTGYSSFTYLKHLPVDFLKIDMEFVRDAVHNESSRHVVNAVVALATAFGLQTVAEGVEDVETLDLLRRLGVDFAQGYYLGRPQPATHLPISNATEHE